MEYRLTRNAPRIKKALEQFDVKNVSECMRKVYTAVLEKSAV